MAQLALTIGGAIVGGVLTDSYQGAALGAAIGGAIGGVVGGLLVHRKGKDSVVQGMTSTWGQPIPILYGTARLPGNMIWCGLMRTSNSSGKGSMMGGSSAPKVHVSFAVAFCAGPVTGLNKIWADGNLIYDATAPGQVQIWNVYSIFHQGDDGQIPDAYYQDWVRKNILTSIDSCPAFRGLCYIIYHDLDLKAFGYRIPQISAEITAAPQNYLPEISFATNTVAGNFQANMVAVDWTSQTVWVPDAANVIHVFSLATTGQIGQSPPLSDSIFATCVVSGIGFFYTVSRANNDIIQMLDPSTFEPVPNYAFGFSASTPGRNVNLGFAAPTQMTALTCTDLTSVNNFLLVSSWWGEYGVLRVLTAQNPGVLYIMGDSASPTYVTLPHIGAYSTQLQVAGASYPGYVEAYILNGTEYSATPTGVPIMKVTIQANASSPTALHNQIYNVPEAGPLFNGITVEQVYDLRPTDFVAGAPDTAWPYGAVISNAAYDPTDDSLIISFGNIVIKWNAAVGVVWRQTVSNAQINSWAFVNGKLGLGTAGHASLLDTSTGAFIINSQAITNPPGGNLPYPANAIYDDASQSLLYVNGSGVYRAYLGLSQATSETLANILTDICLRSGLTLAQIDVTAITQSVQGYVVDSNKTAKEAIAELSAAFFFDAVESDFKIKFVPRDAAGSVATIVQADLGYSGSGETGEVWTQTRGFEQELPSYVQVGFADINNDCQKNSVYAKRTYEPFQSVSTRQRQIINLPITMDVPAAQLIAQRDLWTVWGERDRFDTVVGVNYAWLDATDMVTVNLDDGSSFICRINEIAFGADYSLRIKLIGTDQQAYQQVTTLVGTASPYTQTIKAGTLFPALVMLNVPLLRDQDASAGTATTVYFAAGPIGSSVPAATLQQSADGLNYSQFATTTAGVTWGNCVEFLLPTGSYYAIDWASTITVNLQHSNGDLAGVTLLNLMNGANACLIGNEIVQFMTVTSGGSSSVVLSGFTRGRRGTEWACNTHVAGERFVLLDTNLSVKQLPFSEVNSPYFYKLQPNGQTIDSTSASSWTFLGWDAKPYAPVHFTRTVSGSDLVIAWLRRTRYAGDLADGTGAVTLGEETEAYDLYLLSIPYAAAVLGWAAPVTFVRSFTSLTAPTVTYTAAMMTADGFTPATDTLHAVCFQRSVAVGRGWPGSADLAAF